ncbi:MAG: histidine kinase [Cyclobacteriaceae bacterium]
MNTVIFSMSKKELVFHGLFWLVLLGSLIFAWQDNQLTSPVIFSRFCSWIIAIIVPIYVNALVLIPKFLNRSQWPKYLVLVAGLLIVAKVFYTLFLILPWILEGSDFQLSNEFSRWFFKDFERLDKALFSSSAIILVLSFAYKIGKDQVINEQVKDKLRSKNASMELALLKAQVNPHFLFNVLNNIYATALEENAIKTADNIAKLGTLMRYSLHDSQVDFILLSKEIDYIERYIDMQKMRMTDGDQLRMNVNVNGGDASLQKIAPMILMPFIENAFKYGVSTTKVSDIQVNIGYLEGVLSLQVQNTIHTNSQSFTHGFGLKNVESRLNLIYPNRYQLINEVKEDRYHVNLEIKL